MDRIQRGEHPQMIFPSQLKFDLNIVLLSSEFWRSDHNEILHVTCHIELPCHVKNFVVISFALNLKCGQTLSVKCTWVNKKRDWWEDPDLHCSSRSQMTSLFKILTFNMILNPFWFPKPLCHMVWTNFEYSSKNMLWAFRRKLTVIILELWMIQHWMKQYDTSVSLLLIMYKHVIDNKISYYIWWTWKTLMYEQPFVEAVHCGFVPMAAV